MASFFTEKDCFISEDLEIPTNTHGYNFIHDKRLKGVVVLGKSYPLHGKDLTIEDHLKVFDLINGLKPHGIIYKNQDATHWHEFIYTKQ
jgi:hypothetical protein